MTETVTLANRLPVQVHIVGEHAAKVRAVDVPGCVTLPAASADGAPSMTEGVDITHWVGWWSRNRLSHAVQDGSVYRADDPPSATAVVESAPALEAETHEG